MEMLHLESKMPKLPPVPEYEDASKVQPLGQRQNTSTNGNKTKGVSTSTSAAPSAKKEQLWIDPILGKMYPEGSRGPFKSIEEIELSRRGLLNKVWPTPVKGMLDCQVRTFSR